MSYPQIDCERCIGCELCITQCPVNCIYYDGDNYCMLINLSACLYSACRNCYEVCPAGAVLLDPPLAAPTNLTVTWGGIVVLMPILHWRASPGTNLSYEIWGKTGANGVWGKLYEVGPYASAQTLLDWTDHELFSYDNATYYYEVRAKNSEGRYSAFSNIASFTYTEG